ncbi:MAG: carboxypeptidase regulatory-like domain-containing protein [Planctomycetes bacterium]|nr:carboxypeptidase regulatory-like domain-containing protein [Planctomycetota bacterium]
MARLLIPIALLFALVLGGAAWWATSRLEEFERATHAEVVDPTTARAARASTLDPTPAEHAAPAASSGSTPRSSAAAELGAEALPAIDVIAVARETGAPIEGAEIAALTYLRFNQEAASCATRTKLDLFDPFTLPASALRTVRTDARGHARVSFDESRGVVVARAGGRFGCFELESFQGGWLGMALARRDGSGAFRIELALDEVLTIEVVDTFGRPVGGVPVVYEELRERWGSNVLWRGFADASGAATIDHFQEIRHGRNQGGKLRARTVVVGSEGATSELEEGANAVRLVMPPWGSVIVRTVDETGASVLAENVRGRASQMVVEDFGLLLAGPGEWCADVMTGRAFFPFVALGTQFEACANLALHDVNCATGKGPDANGETIELVLAFDRPCFVWTGRCASASGGIVANAKLHATAWVPDALPMEAECETNTRGEFRLVMGRSKPVELFPFRDAASSSFGPLDVSEELAFGPPAAPSRVTALELRVTSPCAARGQRRRFEAAFERGQHELGDVVLELAPLLVSGRVVDAHGAPAANVVVHAGCSDGRGTPSSSETAVECVSDDDGRFELRGEWSARDVYVWAGSNPYTLTPLRVVPVGTRGVELDADSGAPESKPR